MTEKRNSVARVRTRNPSSRRRIFRPKLVVGFCGGVGAGKDSLAGHLAVTLGFEPIEFAGPLKQLCADQFGWDVVRLSGPDSQAYKAESSGLVGRGGRVMTRREILQQVGTECFRAIDAEHWTKKAVAAAVSELKFGAAGLCFVDMRFCNEAEALRAEFGDRAVIVRVVKEESNALERFRTRVRHRLGMGHASEREWRDVRADLELSGKFGELPRMMAELDGFLENVLHNRAR